MAAPPGGNIAVQAGTYPAFTINKAVRIYPDGSGPVVIDTTLQKLVVRDIPAGAFDLSLHRLVIGGAAPLGMDVVNCDNAILLDRLEVATGAAVPWRLIDDTTRIAVQNCSCSGGPGLRFDNGARGYLSRGTIDVLEVIGGANIVYADVTPGSTQVGMSSTADLPVGAMPDLEVQNLWPSDKPVSVSIHAQPSAFFIGVFSFRRDFVDLTPVFPIDMVLLLDQAQALPFTTGLVGPSGTQTVQLTGPPNPAGRGFCLPMQVLELRPDGTGRMGTSTEIVFVP